MPPEEANPDKEVSTVTAVTPATSIPATSQGVEVQKVVAVQAFYDAKTNEERKAAAGKYPVLRQIFSASYFE